MGAGASKQHLNDNVEVFNGVRITPELVSKLTGVQIPRLDSGAAAGSDGGGTAQALRAPDQAERDASVMIRRSELLQRALERSRRVGDALLAREDEELAKIEGLAEELIEREYSTPSKARPCQTEAAECLQCYRDNADNPAACAGAVQAYSACAREATAAALRSEA